MLLQLQRFTANRASCTGPQNRYIHRKKAEMHGVQLIHFGTCWPRPLLNSKLEFPRISKTKYYLVEL